MSPLMASRRQIDHSLCKSLLRRPTIPPRASRVWSVCSTVCGSSVIAFGNLVDWSECLFHVHYSMPETDAAFYVSRSHLSEGLNHSRRTLQRGTKQRLTRTLTVRAHHLRRLDNGRFFHNGILQTSSWDSPCFRGSFPGLNHSEFLPPDLWKVLRPLQVVWKVSVFWEKICACAHIHSHTDISERFLTYMNTVNTAGILQIVQNCENHVRAVLCSSFHPAHWAYQLHSAGVVHLAISKPSYKV
jgi:hypothetical protein